MGGPGSSLINFWIVGMGKRGAGGQFAERLAGPDASHRCSRHMLPSSRPAQ